MGRKFGHKFTHIFYFQHTGKTPRDIKIEKRKEKRLFCVISLFDTCDRSSNLFSGDLQNKKIDCQELCCSTLPPCIEYLKFRQRSFRPAAGTFGMDQMDKWTFSRQKAEPQRTLMKTRKDALKFFG